MPVMDSAQPAELALGPAEEGAGAFGSAEAPGVQARLESRLRMRLSTRRPETVLTVAAASA